MQAVLVERYGDIDRISVQEVPTPEPGPGEVLVQVAAAGLGFVDSLKVAGKYQTKDPLPFIPGTDLAGIVRAVGAGVSELSVGDRVAGYVARGALAEYAAVPVGEAELIPDSLPFEAGAAYRVNHLTALYALRYRAQAKPGETLLVLGASGGTGSAAIAIGKLLGLHVIAAASNETKRQFALDSGADDTVDYTDPEWRAKLREKHESVDIVFDPIGGPVGGEAFRAVGWGGRFLVIGFAAGDIPVAKYNVALLKGSSLVGVDIAQVPRRDPEIWREINTDLAAWLASGALKPALMIFDGLGSTRDALRSMTNREAMGKVVVRVADLGA